MKKMSQRRKKNGLKTCVAERKYNKMNSDYSCDARNSVQKLASLVDS